METGRPRLQQQSASQSVCRSIPKLMLPTVSLPAAQQGHRMMHLQPAPTRQGLTSAEEGAKGSNLVPASRGLAASRLAPLARSSFETAGVTFLAACGAAA